MKERAQIIILNTTAFGDKSLILHCISDLWGRRSFIVSRSSKTAPVVYRPMNILDCEVTINPKSDLWRVGSVTLKHPLTSIQSSMEKTSLCMFMSEVLYRTVREPAQDDAALFLWCEQNVLTLEALQNDFANFHILFLLGLSSALGFAPTREALAPFVGEAYSTAGEFLTLPAAEAMLLPLSGARRTELCRSIIKYLEHHTESRIDIKSLDVLHQIFV